ncbi:hypothetical protein GVAV_000913 [Gurleya vavrai]
MIFYEKGELYTNLISDDLSIDNSNDAEISNIKHTIESLFPNNFTIIDRYRDTFLFIKNNKNDQIKNSKNYSEPLLTLTSFYKKLITLRINFLETCFNYVTEQKINSFYLIINIHGFLVDEFVKYSPDRHLEIYQYIYLTTGYNRKHLEDKEMPSIKNLVDSYLETFNNLFVDQKEFDKNLNNFNKILEFFIINGVNSYINYCCIQMFDPFMTDLCLLYEFIFKKLIESIDDEEKFTQNFYENYELIFDLCLFLHVDTIVFKDNLIKTLQDYPSLSREKIRNEIKFLIA